MDSKIRESFIIKNIYRYQRIYRRTFIICAVVIAICMTVSLHPVYRTFGISSSITMLVLGLTQFTKLRSFNRAINSIEAGDEEWRTMNSVVMECNVESGRSGFAVVALILLIIVCLASGIGLMAITDSSFTVVRMVAMLFLCSAAYLISSLIVYWKMFRGSLAIEKLEIESGMYTDEEIQEMRAERRQGFKSSITLILITVIPIAIGAIFMLL